ncbi:MAG: hypothetical protein ACK5CA_17610 [Cyanobacteriota bacterium]|jgi:hypothetical protein
MSHSESNASLNYQGLALTSLVVGGIAAGIGLTNIEPAQAENPRVSVAVTNIQSNTNSQSFAAEIVAPATNFYFTGASVDVTYVNASATTGSTDLSQIVITTGTMTTVGIDLPANTFESATARAVNNALAEARYGDLIGFVNAYNGAPAGAENPSVSVALTNIQSNTSSQNFAAEIVAPMTDQYFTAVNATVTYENATSVGIADASQFLINTASISAAAVNYTATTVETATADAIDTLNTNRRFGDVTGIVNAWQGGGSAALD